MPSKMRPSRIPASASGLAVDASGGPAVDPTENVIALTEAAVARQDDLRDATIDLFTQSQRHAVFVAELRAAHQRELDTAESRRLDAIRQVDREDVKATAAQALSAIQTLANTTATTAETLRTQVSTTAAAAATQLGIITGEINKRLSALELSSSEGKGKQMIADPRTDKLTEAVEALIKANAMGVGKQEGIRMSGGLIVGGIGLLFSVLSIAGILIGLVLFLNRTPGNAPAYVPAPYGTTLPTAPPAVPR